MNRIAPLKLLMLFVVGAVGGLIGDAGHVQSGTTVYLDTAGIPFIWESPVTFPIMVGVATVLLAELRLRIAPARDVGEWTDGVGAVGVVIGIYAVTALVRDEPLLPSSVIVFMLAAIAWHVSGDGRAATICGLVAASVGTVAEIILVQVGFFRYAPEIDLLFGVPPWLPALYFAFGVVAARLGELCVAPPKGATA
ncbi:MAG: DUF2878 family protein [Thermoleophilaceae bacterium]|nr:DUF2878 family protein [Thermoleophilaceae bacterium]